MVGLERGSSSKLEDDQLLAVSSHDLSLVCMQRDRGRETRISDVSFSYKSISPIGLRPHPDDLI